MQTFHTLPDAKWLMACLLCLVILAWLRCWRLMALPLGFIWAFWVADSQLAQRLPESMAGNDIAVQGWITDLPDQTEDKVRFDFLLDLPEQSVPKKLRLSWYHTGQQIKAGQHWKFTVRMKPPHGSLNPGGFDYERWLFTQGIGATGYVRPYPQPELLGQDPPWRNIDVVRQRIADRLDAVLPDSGLIKALTIGEGSGIGPQQWDVFRKTGTIHLMVISGSHIGMVAGLVYWLVLKGWAWTGVLRWSPQRVAAWAAMSAGIGYAALAGFSVPSQRAVVMLVVFMLAIIQQRPLRPFHTLSVALLAVLLYDPLAVLSPGFWLSFLAVAVIIFTVGGRLGKSSWWLEAFKINWATSVGLSPLLVFFFQQVSLCSPIANFVAVPVIGLLVVPLALLAVALLFLDQDLAGGLLGILDHILQTLYSLLAQMANWPWATLTQPQPPLWSLLFAVPGIALLISPRGIPNRWLGAVMLLPLFTVQPKPLANGELAMILLDVGQGLAAVVQTAGHWLVYDTGAKFSAESDSGSMVIVPYLRSRGVTGLDGLVISHGDNDHIGGVHSLLQEIPADKLYTSVPEQLADYRPQPCVSGQSWVWDGVKFDMLWPEVEKLQKENDQSCVLKITGKFGSLVLTGDIERAAESVLVGQLGENLSADVLVAPHHGSKTSSSLSFLRSVKPKWVLIPAGYRNSFGHPHESVLARYFSNQITASNTAEQGALTVTFDQTGVSLKKYRESDGKYWNWQAASLQ